MIHDDSVQIAATSPVRRRALARVRRGDGAPGGARKRGPCCGGIGNFLPCKALKIPKWEKNPNSQAAQQSFEPTRLCRRIAARDGSRQKRSRPEMAPQRLIRLNQRREMVWSRKRRPTRSGTGACGSLARLQLTFRGPAERLAREARRALGVGCRPGSRVDQGRRRTRSWSLSRGGGAMEAEIFRLAKP